MSVNVGVVGATGVVGEVFLDLIEQRKFPVGNIKLFASQKSAGLKKTFKGRSIAIEALNEGCFNGLDLVFFSSGDDISKEWAPKAVAAGAFAIDNSAAFRMDEGVPLVVPEINADLIPARSKPCIIANPNCSTIQLVVVLEALKKFDLKQAHVSSYQAVSGAGKEGRDELIDQLKEYLDGAETVTAKVFPHQIAFNCIPQIGSINDQGFCTEELKIMRETKKILRLPQLKVSAFTVRIPALNAHSESVWLQMGQDVTRDQMLKAFADMPGLEVLDQPAQSKYPTAFEVSGQDPVYVGRIHQDLEDKKTWIFWIVSDNLRKGAALNGIQIAEKIFC